MIREENNQGVKNLFTVVVVAQWLLFNLSLTLQRKAYGKKNSLWQKDH